MNRPFSLLGVHPNHLGRGKPSTIELAIILDYIKGNPVEVIVLTPSAAIKLIEQLALAIRVTTDLP